MRLDSKSLWLTPTNTHSYESTKTTAQTASVGVWRTGIVDFIDTSGVFGCLAQVSHNGERNLRTSHRINTRPARGEVVLQLAIAVAIMSNGVNEGVVLYQCNGVFLNEICLGHHTFQTIATNYRSFLAASEVSRGRAALIMLFDILNTAVLRVATCVKEKH